MQPRQPPSAADRRRGAWVFLVFGVVSLFFLLQRQELIGSSYARRPLNELGSVQEHVGKLHHRVWRSRTAPHLELDFELGGQRFPLQCSRTPNTACSGEAVHVRPGHEYVLKMPQNARGLVVELREQEGEVLFPASTAAERLAPPSFAGAWAGILLMSVCFAVSAVLFRMAARQSKTAS